MAKQVMDAAPRDVNCRLLLVACGELKVKLATKAEAIAHGLARLVVEELQASADSIGKSYETIHSRLQMSCGSAEEVVEMNEYLQASEAQMLELQASIDRDLEARLALLSSLNFELEDDCFASVYNTVGWPGRVYKVAADATKKQVSDGLPAWPHYHL